MTDNPPHPPWDSTPATTEALRHEIQADYDRLEANAHDLIASPGPALASNGEDIALGPDGQPLPDENIRREARQLLADLRRDRANSNT